MYPILGFQAQRERFRKRNEELEEEQSRLSSHVVSLQSEVSDLQADNVKLYEKIKFLQGFQVSETKFLLLYILMAYSGLVNFSHSLVLKNNET